MKTTRITVVCIVWGVVVLQLANVAIAVARPASELITAFTVVGALVRTGFAICTTILWAKIHNL